VSVAGGRGAELFSTARAQWRLRGARSLVNQEERMKWTDVRRDAGGAKSSEVDSAACARGAEEQRQEPISNACL